ncbi:hypothetical protein SAMN05421848_2481 [Kushneria avicenniae]|uniref:Uncharacterized protein n=1 Tax=Kushneria avicenniae TaxID=402385 RepID=A0A1I1LTE5_9GAMM|nr:hypothetical protein [Kushneria avicenniae]SFC72730.1 hypothetical protein SAMN05421848_2481 [Kushneria avicenniae]
MRPTDINIRCFHCGSRRMTVRAGHMRPVDDPVHCRDCDTYLGRRSDLAFERRRLITGAANEPFDVQSGAVALHVPVTLKAIQTEETPAAQPPRTTSRIDQGA